MTRASPADHEPRTPAKKTVRNNIENVVSISKYHNGLPPATIIQRWSTRQRREKKKKKIIES